MKELKNVVDIRHTDYDKECSECKNQCIRNNDVKDKQISIFNIKDEVVYYCQICGRHWR